MNRLKIALFALVALGALGYLLMVSPGAATRGVELAAGAINGAGPAVALKVEAQRSALQAAVVKLAASPAVWNLGPKAPPAKPEAPSADRLNLVRAAVAEALGEKSAGQAWVAVTNEVGTLVAQGAGDPGPPPDGFEVAPLVAGGAAGALATVGGAPTLFYATPLLVADKGEVRVAGQALVGLPLLPDAKQLEGVAKDLKLTTLALVSNGKVLVAAGPDKSSAEPANKALKPGQVASLASGPVRELGPIALPLFVPVAPHNLGLRQALTGAPFEVVAVVSTREPLDALAGLQATLLFALLGVLLAGVGATVAVKNPEHEEGGMVAPPPMPLPPLALKKDRESTAEMALDHPHGPEASPDDFHFPEAPPASNPSIAISTGSLAVPPPPPASTGQSPVFLPAATGQEPAFVPGGSTGQEPAFLPGPSTGQAAAFQPSGATGSSPLFSPPPPPLNGRPGTGSRTAIEPEEDPFAAAAPPSAPPGPAFPSARPPSNPAAQAVPPAPRPSMGRAPPPPISSQPPVNPFDDEGESRTVAYPVFNKPPPPVADPFALASQHDEPATHSYEDSPDATRVAAVPQELIKAARQSVTGMTGERPALKVTTQQPALPKVQSVIGSTPGGDAEERHFQDVFRDFVATREKCGEPADGLTYDKFRAKLVKNKDQLVAKYQCRTVRFQVYVKEGKAALKATPVKD